MLLDLLGATGVTLILVRGDVFAWLRRAPGLRALLKCAMCSGWWVGAVAGVARLDVHQAIVSQAAAVVELGGAVSATATLLDFVLAYLDFHTETTRT